LGKRYDAPPKSVVVLELYELRGGRAYDQHVVDGNRRAQDVGVRMVIERLGPEAPSATERAKTRPSQSEK